MEQFKTVLTSSVGEYEEKRSKFIGVLSHVESEQEAIEFINSVREKHREARHNVHAFVVKENGISRFSDDGEPHGTAGKPILDVIKGFELQNVCLVVTRYFGGILLGTGGLCHAYGTAARLACQSADIVTMKMQKQFVIVCDYQQHNRLIPFIESCGGNVEDTKFSDNVRVTFSLESPAVNNFVVGLNEMFCGKLNAECIGEGFSPV